MDENPGGTPNPLNPNPVTPGVGVADAGENMSAIENYIYATEQVAGRPVEAIQYAEQTVAEQPMQEAEAMQYAEPMAQPQPMSPMSQPTQPMQQPAQQMPQQPAFAPRPPMHGQAMDFIQRPAGPMQMSPEMMQAQMAAQAQMAQMAQMNQMAQMQAAQMAQPMMQPTQPMQPMMAQPVQQPMTQSQMPQMSQPGQGQAMDIAGFESFAMESQPMATDPMVAQMGAAMQGVPAGAAPEEELAMAIDEVAATEPATAAQPTSVKPKKSMKGKKQKKTGMIVAIVLFGVAIICGLAAVLVWLLNPGQDKVAAAINKILDGNAPANVQASGTIALNSDSPENAWSGLNIQLTAMENTSTTASALDATVTMGLKSGGEASFDAELLRVSDGDLYFRVSGIAATMEDALMAPAGDVLDTEAVEANGEEYVVVAPELDVSEMLLGTLELIDGEWIRVPADYSSSEMEVGMFDNSSVCLVNAMASLPKYYSNLSALYRQNPFIGYSTDNLKIARKANDLYRLSFDRAKFTAFENGLNNSAFANELLACTGGTATNEDLTLAQVESILTANPAVYVEIDNSNNFTRFYLNGETADGETTATADLALSYPASISVTEPTDYIDITDMLTAILTQVFGDLSGEDSE